jgi:glutathione S-transferase
VGESVHVDIFRFENYESAYTRLNPKAVVPTLDHDGRILIESNVILEYLEDVFPQVRLRPEDPYERSLMRLWVYNSEELGHWNLNVCSHNARHAKRLQAAGISDATVLAAADKCPNPMIGQRLRRRVEVGVSEQEEGEAIAKLEYMLGLMEERLAHGPWLAGETYSLADIAMAPMINRIDALGRPDMIAADRRPNIAAWWQSMQARPVFQEAFSFRNPDASDPLKR